MRTRSTADPPNRTAPPLPIPGPGPSVYAVAVHPRTAEAHLESLAARWAAYGSGRPIDPESLHQFHRDLRRARLEYGLWSRTLPPGRSRPVERFLVRLEQISRLTGEVRDRDVGQALLEQHIAETPETATARYLRRLDERLAREGIVGRELLRGQLRANSEGALGPKALRTAVERSETTRRPSLSPIVEQERKRYAARTRRAVRRARKRPTVRRLHRLRKALRDARAFRAVEHGLGDEARPRYPRTLERLQGELGRLHDMDILLARLTRLGTGVALESWRRQLDEERTRIRQAIVDEISRRGTRRRIKRFVAG